MAKFYYYNPKLLKKKVKQSKESKKASIRAFISTILMIVLALVATYFISKNMLINDSDESIISLVIINIIIFIASFGVVALLWLLLRLIVAIIKSILYKILRIERESEPEEMQSYYTNNFSWKSKIKLLLSDDKIIIWYEYFDGPGDMGSLAYGMDTIYYSDIKRIVYSLADHYLHLDCKYTFNQTSRDYDRIYTTHTFEEWYNFCLLFEDDLELLNTISLKSNLQIENINDEKYNL
ncbi:MAG TPA: hypothetical protein PKK61_00805 [Defluviitaleaceae bacterium]|nr:hypothetical protein [Candidatus Epulonipiscium sp.]HOA79591.1 hypothetical protein [Defluviitaleaceae bacterium]